MEAGRSVRSLSIPNPSAMSDRSIGEIRPRYESDLSFRVAGKVLSRLVDVGAWVKQGDTLATLDTQDYQNRLRSAEADVSSPKRRSSMRRERGAPSQALERRLDAEGDLSTRRCSNLQAAEARLKAAKANLDLTRDQLNYTSSRPISTA